MTIKRGEGVRRRVACVSRVKRVVGEERSRGSLPREGRQGGAPGRILQIRAETVESSVLARPALHVAEERGTDLADERLRGVDQRQALLDLLVGQSVSERVCRPRIRERGRGGRAREIGSRERGIGPCREMASAENTFRRIAAVYLRMREIRGDVEEQLADRRQVLRPPHLRFWTRHVYDERFVTRDTSGEESAIESNANERTMVEEKRGVRRAIAMQLENFCVLLLEKLVSYGPNFRVKYSTRILSGILHKIKILHISVI